jgi:hypothetical protein
VPEDGINAVRQILGRREFDRAACVEGLKMMRPIGGNGRQGGAQEAAAIAMPQRTLSFYDRETALQLGGQSHVPIRSLAGRGAPLGRNNGLKRQAGDGARYYGVVLAPLPYRVNFAEAQLSANGRSCKRGFTLIPRFRARGPPSRFVTLRLPLLRDGPYASLPRSFDDHLPQLR